MARPNNLSTKGEFSVFQVVDGYWELRFMGRVVVCGSSSRSLLYRERAKYRSWYSVITRLQQSLNRSF